MCSTIVSKESQNLVVVAQQGNCVRKAVVRHCFLVNGKIPRVLSTEILNAISTVMGVKPNHSSAQKVFDDQVAPEIKSLFSQAS